MEYRIKIIQKYNEEQLFIPQYREGDYISTLAFKILLSPLAFLLWLTYKDKELIEIKEYFDTWISIRYNKETFREIHNFFINNEMDAVCENKEKAEVIIKTHRQVREDKLKKEQEEQNVIKMNKVKKTLYIKVK